MIIMDTINYPIKTIFFGTPAFTLPAFDVLYFDQRFNVEAVYTQPDKPIGRKKILMPPPVKLAALKKDIPVFQPESLKNGITAKQVEQMQPGLIVVFAYGQIFSQDILEIPRFGCINIHLSLLPRWRGATPVANAIMSGDKLTGVTYMLMDMRLDNGPIISQIKESIKPFDNSATLTERLAVIAADNLIEVLVDYIDGRIISVPQVDKRATVCKIFTRGQGHVDWGKSAVAIDRQIRALFPWPGTFSEWKGKRLKIINAEVGPSMPVLKPGEVGKIDGLVLVGTGQGNLILKNIQFEGGKVMSGDDFLNGHSDFLGSKLQ